MFLPKSPIDNSQHWFSKWFGAVQATSHHRIQWLLGLVPCICVIWLRWVYELLCSYYFTPADRIRRDHFMFPHWEETKWPPLCWRYQIHFIVWFFIKIPLEFISKDPTDNMSGLVQIMAWWWSETNRYVNQQVIFNHIISQTVIPCISGAIGLTLSVWIWIPQTLITQSSIHNNGNHIPHYLYSE